MSAIAKNNLMVFLASDHAGVTLKSGLSNWLALHQIPFADMGCSEGSGNVDYPDYALRVVNALESSISDPAVDPTVFGILLCKSGAGMCISANRHPKIRAAVCTTIEAATLARQHNNINILCMGESFVNISMANKIMETFLSTPFLGGRHIIRLTKID